MLGASRTSITALRERLDALYQDSSRHGEFADAGRGVLAIAEVIGSDRALRRLVGDSSTAPAIKSGVLTELFGSKVPPLSLELANQVVDTRWSNDRDLIAGLEFAGDSLLLMAAESRGELDQVEEQLFRFLRAVEASPDLQMAMSDPSIPVDGKSEIVRSLLSDKANPVTTDLIAYAAGHLRGRRMVTVLGELGDLAAERRGQIVADVRTAHPLSEDQRVRLAAVLSRIHGRDVVLNVEQDPTVVGGLSIRVGDDVIDGTIASKLEAARRQLS